MRPSPLNKPPGVWWWLAAAAVGLVAGVGGFTFIYAGGHSYLSNRPEVCVNCHIMRENYDSWGVSAHRGETCNDCHVPHFLPEKYFVKGENGFRHSWAFTFEDTQVIKIRDASLRIVNSNCRRCHGVMTDAVVANESDPPVDCARCHKGAGHVY